MGGAHALGDIVEESLYVGGDIAKRVSIGYPGEVFGAGLVAEGGRTDEFSII